MTSPLSHSISTNKRSPSAPFIVLNTLLITEPRVILRTRHAGLERSYLFGLVEPRCTDVRVQTWWCRWRCIALPWLEIFNLRQRCRVLHPLNNLIDRHEVHIFLTQHGLYEFLKSFGIHLFGEPGWTQEHVEGGAVGAVVSLKVGHEELEDFRRWNRVRAWVDCVTARTWQVAPHDDGKLPNARVWVLGTWIDHAVIVDQTVQCEGKEGRLAFEDRHGRIEGEVVLVKHGKLIVASDGQVGSPHTVNVRSWDVAEKRKDLALTDNFLFPRTQRPVAVVLQTAIKWQSWDGYIVEKSEIS